MGNELSLIVRSPASLGKPTKKDRNIWVMKMRGWTDDQLATRFNIGIDKVRLAVDRWILHQASYSNDVVDLAINEMVIRQLPKVEKVFERGMTAQKVEVEMRGKNAIRRKVADHHTQIKTVDSFKSLLESVRPKGVGVQVNTQINNPGKEQSVTPRGFDFESRLRMIRQEKGLTNDEGTMEGDFEEVDDRDSLANEMAEIGIELPPEDDEEEDEEEDDE